MSLSWLKYDTRGGDAEWCEKFAEVVKGLVPKVSGKGWSESAAALQEIINNKEAPLTLTDVRDRPERFFAAHRIVAYYCSPEEAPGFWIRFTVHYNLCFGTVVALGEQPHLDQLGQIMEKADIGCFALTEYKAGVNSGMVVETIADYDKATDEFVITTGSGEIGDPAEKNWISSGMMATYAIVVADLRVDGKSYGGHAFLVRMRETVGGPCLPGVHMVDMGKKTIGNDLDNARIGLNKVRVPRSTLLSRYGDVKDGKYVQKDAKIKNFQMIGQRLFTGRVAVAAAALMCSRKLVTRTKAYADSKMTWSPEGSRPLSQLPQVKALFDEADFELSRLEMFVKKVELALADVVKQDGTPDLELQVAIGTCKIACAERNIALLNRLKMDVGSYALMDSSGLQHIDFLQACKFAEGDSRILAQKMVRDLVGDVLKGKKRQGMMPANGAGNAPEAMAEEEALLKDLLGKLSKAGNDKKAFGKIWEAEWRQVYKLADCIQNRIILNWCGNVASAKL